MISNTYDLFGELNAKEESREAGQSDKGGCYMLMGCQGRTLKRRELGKDLKEVREIIIWISKGQVFQGGEEQVQGPSGEHKPEHLCVWRVLGDEAREIIKG